MAKYSSRIPAKDWEDRKSRILALYTAHTLNHVLECITTPDFSPRSVSIVRAKSEAAAYRIVPLNYAGRLRNGCVRRI